MKEDIFYDKVLILKKDSTRLEDNGDIEYLYDKDWYVFNANYGTSEERNLVRFIDNLIDSLNEKYEDIFLIRNELHFYIYNFDDGNAFAPDFVLFLRDKEDNLLNLQIFIEPKGEHLMEHDKWKEDLLNDISIKKKLTKLDETEEFIKIMESARKDILAQLAVNKTLKDIAVTEEECKKFYEENPQHFTKGATVEAKHILVADEEECKTILASIENGEKEF